MNIILINFTEIFRPVLPVYTCLYLFIHSPNRGLLALKEDTETGQWERRRLCIGDARLCPGADSLPPFINAFGQDDGGEVYVLATSVPSIDPNAPATGAIYQIADPAR